MPNYHDVTVYVGNIAYQPSKDYSLQLQCTKAGGWSLWRVWGDVNDLIGGEYDLGPFCIKVGDMVICGQLPDDPQPADDVIWDGLVETAVPPHPDA